MYVAGLVFAFGIAVADPPDSSTHQALTPPGKADAVMSRVYVEELELYETENGIMLRLEGNLPTPCHNLSPPEHDLQQDTLTVTLSSWHKPGAMCVQVLVPFVYYYNLPIAAGKPPRYLRVDDTIISFDPDE